MLTTPNPSPPPRNATHNVAGGRGGELKAGKSKIFLWMCLSFAGGVAAGPYSNFIIMALGAMIFIILITIWWDDKRARIAGLAGLVLLLGALRYQMILPQEDENFIGKYYGQELTLEVVVVREPDVRSDKVNLTVRSAPSPHSASRSGSETPQGRTTSSWPRGRPGEGKITGNILLNLGKYPEYQYGDRLKIFGKVEEPFETEEFSYKDYLARYDTYAVMRFPEIEQVGEGQGHPVKASLLGLKRKFQTSLSQVLPEPHNALAGGIVLGTKRSIPEDLKNALIAVGVSHIIVISGYNMSIITQNILKTRKWLGRRIALALSFLLVLGFVIITGADASVVRAAVMAMLVVAALNLGRIYISLNALVFVAALMILQNPRILAFDIGFQLSFMATAGLIYLGSWFEKRLAWVPAVLEFRKNLASTLAAQIFALPLLIYYFERVSAVSLLVNILILWTIPYAMFFALAAGGIGMFYLPAGKFIGIVLWAVLEFLLRVVEFFARLPFIEFSIGIPFMLVAAYYFLLFWALCRLPAKNMLIFSHDGADS